MTATELVGVFNELADTPEELKTILLQSSKSVQLKDRLRLWHEKSQQRLNDLSAQIDVITNQYEAATQQANLGVEPTNVPDIAAEDAALV